MFQNYTFKITTETPGKNEFNYLEPIHHASGKYMYYFFNIVLYKYLGLSHFMQLDILTPLYAQQI